MILFSAYFKIFDPAVSLNVPVMSLTELVIHTTRGRALLFSQLNHLFMRLQGNVFKPIDLLTQIIVLACKPA